MLTKTMCMIQLVSQLIGFYPVTMEVINLDYDNDNICMSTATGLHFDVPGCSDYAIGDLASCIVYNNGTPDDNSDDIIVKHRYAGWFTSNHENYEEE